MLYQAMRPRTFDEVIGNSSAIKALRKSVKIPGRAHCYLFHGPSGCGKTTLARILASELGCIPMNVEEINAAQSRGIDMARELTEHISFAPMGGGQRCVILDEAHMLTREAQNGLLKVLEDVADYQYFILCSTDPDKLLKTIRTRCEHVAVSRLVAEEMMELLLVACTKVNATGQRMLQAEPSDAVMLAIVKAADGCPREALVFLEKQDGIPEADALKIITPHYGAEGEVLSVCRALVNGQPWAEMMKAIDLVKDPDWEGMRQAVLGYLASCLARSGGSKFAGMIRELRESVFYTGRAGMLSALYFASTVR